MVTGSSAMLSEGVYSLVDSINETLLIYGMSRRESRVTPAALFGYGRELYFWSFTSRCWSWRWVRALSAEFEDTLHTTDIEQCITRVEHAAKSRHPLVTDLFIKPQTREIWMARWAQNQAAG